MHSLIQFPASVSIRLRQIVLGNGSGVITAWLAGHAAARARFRIRVRDLQKIPRVDWNVKQFRNLGGGLSEIKWNADGKQWRAMGFDFKGFFVMVLGCTHKQNVYDPAECIKSARKRQKEVERGEWNVADYDL